MFLFAKSTSAWAAIALALGAFMMVSLMLYITVDSNARRRQPSYQGLASVSFLSNVDYDTYIKSKKI
jgi:hypothetical protein